MNKRSITLAAHAKINLVLNVLSKRPDGYHEVAMLMQQVSLSDQIRIRVHDEPGVKVTCPGLELDDKQENIAGRAARLLLGHVDLNCGVEVHIEKKIPAAAGLGGGSSDAAAVLRGLNQLLRLSLPRSELMDLGVRLGADVPFFLLGQTAWATGIGEKLETWPGTPPFWMVLANPGITVSTAWVYQNLGLTHSRPPAKIPRFPEGVHGLVRLLHNDLEAVTCERYPIVQEIKQQLLERGALGALMSGSGPTVFGVFNDPYRASATASSLTETYGWWADIASPR